MTYKERQSAIAYCDPAILIPRNLAAVIQCVRADKLFEAFAPIEPKFNDLFSIGKVARVLVQVKFAFLISTGNDLH